MEGDAVARALVISLACVVVLFAAFIGALWYGGFFQFSGSDPSSKVVAASLTVVAAFITALLALMGAILKLSADRQTELRLAAESQRNDTLAQAAADRLQLEAAVKAVQLLATTGGQLSPSIQRAGALFALATLKQFDLTLALTSELLARDELEPSAAARLTNLALHSADDATQRQAADILASNVKQFLTRTDFEFPQCVLDCNHKLGTHAREWTAIALTRLAIARPVNDWEISKLVPIIAALTLAHKNETDGRLKNDIGVLLGEIVHGFPEIDQIIHPRQVLEIDSVRAEVAGTHPISAVVESLADSIRSWRADRKTPDFSGVE